MRYYPQLLTGGYVQYPVRRARTARTADTAHVDGRLISLSDHRGNTVRWTLQYTSLSDSELEILKTFFDQCEGRLHSFLFLDPLDNLLSRTDRVNGAPWLVDPGLAIVEGLAGPFGIADATRVTNTSAAPQRIMQACTLPASLQYTFSAYARASAAAELGLTLGSAEEPIVSMRTINAEWTRVHVSAALQSTTEVVEAAITIWPGQSVDLAGFQLEAQRSPSGYRAQAGRGGIYPSTRFDQDSFESTTTGLDSHDTVVTLVSRDD